MKEFWRERRGEGAREACWEVGADQNSYGSVVFAPKTPVLE